MHRQWIAAIALAGGLEGMLAAQTAGPDPKEIPVPPIATGMRAMPGVDRRPDHPAMPDVLTRNDGKKVTRSFDEFSKEGQ